MTDSTHKPGDITLLLRSSAQGSRADADRLMAAIYDDLKRIAAGQLQNERQGHTLHATALVHEAYLRLIQQHSVDWNDRLHFFSIASRVIRRILIDYARERNAIKRGGKASPISLEHHDPTAPISNDNLLALDEALTHLATLSERQSQIVELRYFGGLTISEIAEALSIGNRTVDREWQTARAWLFHHMTGAADDTAKSEPNE